MPTTSKLKKKFPFFEVGKLNLGHFKSYQKMENQAYNSKLNSDKFYYFLREGAYQKKCGKYQIE